MLGSEPRCRRQKLLHLNPDKERYFLMIAEKISFVNYRNIEKAQIEFCDGVNLIYGDNAKGKTNVLEAVYSYARGKSFRSASERELVRFGCEGYHTELVFRDKNRVQSMSLGYADKKRQKKINGVVCDKLSDMIGRFRAVMFCPEHLDIVKGGPGQRREFLNIAISQLDGTYIKEFSKYKAILENRNALLRRISICDDPKKKGALSAQLDIFSTQLSECAAYICAAREKYIRGISPFAEFFLGEMSEDSEKLSLEFECDIDKSIRDDIKICINSVDARSFASQGQQRSIALSLKMAEGEMSRECVGEYPVFLFDDVLSELDVKRRSYLMSKISDRQLIITSCEISDIRDVEGARFIKALGGGIYEASDRIL